MKNQIIGIAMHPCFMEESEFEEAYASSKYGTRDKFMDKYREHMSALEIIAGCAKSYILNHYEKIKDWSDLEVEITDNSKKKTYYVNYVPGKFKGDILGKLDEYYKKNHNPIKTITDVVLDPTDGDFSLTINGKDHMWIDEHSVIIIANFIEERLNDNQR